MRLQLESYDFGDSGEADEDEPMAA